MTPVQVPAPPPLLLLDRTRHRGIGHRAAAPATTQKSIQKIRICHQSNQWPHCRPPSMHAGEASHLLYKMQGKENASSLSAHVSASSTHDYYVVRFAAGREDATQEVEITAVRKSEKLPRGFTMKFRGRRRAGSPALASRTLLRMLPSGIDNIVDRIHHSSAFTAPA